MKEKRWRDYGFRVGSLDPGERNKITDVPGLLVGHTTLDEGDIKTGVTALLPHQGNLFVDKVRASSYVFNGFGKTTGLMQIEELGTIETPILLTNTLSVGAVYEAVVEYMMKDNEEIGAREGTVNPIVCECNDGYLNAIRKLSVKREHVFQAINNAREDFLEGGVGAGAGMCSFGLKGGIGSASCRIDVGEKNYTLGSLVLSNFGRREDLMINGHLIGPSLARRLKTSEREIDGSIIILLATDLPLSFRQLKRMAKRSAIGLIRLGSFLDTGSGDLAIAFSTSDRIPQKPEEDFFSSIEVRESLMDLLFRAAGQVTEEAVLNSLVCAKESRGYKGHHLTSLRDHLDLLP